MLATNRQPTVRARPVGGGGSHTRGRTRFIPPKQLYRKWEDETGQHHTVYTVGSFLGRGGFAECYELRDRETGEVFAGKLIPKAKLVKRKQMEKLKMEIQVHSKLCSSLGENRHDNIVRFHCWFKDANFVVIVLEMCSNQSMMELIRKRRRLTETEARYYMSQVISALVYMHGMLVIHRDLKLGNIFLDHNMVPKVGDFGLATELSSEGDRKETICGTPNYIAPEILKSSNGHSFEVDVWSLGVILYTWIIGRPPFETKDVRETYRRIQRSNYTFPPDKTISPEARDLIELMLQRRPDQRPTLEAIQRHAFFQRHTVAPKLPATALMCTPKGISPARPAHLTRAPAGTGGTEGGPRRVLARILSPRSQPLASSGAHAAPGTPPAASLGARAPSPAPQRRKRAPTASTACAIPMRLDAGAASGDEDPRRVSGVHEPPTKTMRMRSATTAAVARLPAQQQPNFAVPALPSGASSAMHRSASAPVGRVNIIDVIFHALKSALGPIGTAAPMCPSDGSTKGSSSSSSSSCSSLHSSAASPSRLLSAEMRSLSLQGGARPPAFWIRKWGDYSRKYAMAYELNDGSFGAHFNDATSMVLQSDGRGCEYVQRDGVGQERRQCFAFEAHPEPLQKKANLLRYFQRYMDQAEQQQLEAATAACTCGGAGAVGACTCDAVRAAASSSAGGPRAHRCHSGAPGAANGARGSPMVYLKKWMKTKHAMFFRLSDNTLQVSFTDMTEIVLTEGGGVVTFVDKQDVMHTHRVKWVIDQIASGNSLHKLASVSTRLAYVRDMLGNFINKRPLTSSQ